MMKRSKKSEETLTSCMDEMRQTLGHLEPCDVCKELSVTTQDYEDEQLHAHSRVHQVCHVSVGFHVLCVDLGFHVVIGVGRLTVQQESFIRQLHFTTHTSFQVQSSFLLDVVVRLCPDIVNSICVSNACIFHIAKTGLLRCCKDMKKTGTQTARRSGCESIIRGTTRHPVRRGTWSRPRRDYQSLKPG